MFFLQTVFVTEVSGDCTIVDTLRVGSKGLQVQCLQEKVGVVADGSFGPLTKNAVIIFQLNNSLVADGIVGPLSRFVLHGVLANGSIYPTGCVSSIGYSPITGAKCDGSPKPQTDQASLSIPSPDYVPVSQVQPPKVFSVYPEKVRSGNTVKIYGENFSFNRNTVLLQYGQIEARFEDLPSSDGKVISFVFQPPEVKTMNKEELLNLPSTLLNQILDPVQAVGGSIDDIVAPYRDMKNEDDLRKMLNDNGHNFDELYEKFWVTIENGYGSGSSQAPILSGLRKLSFGSDLTSSENKNFLAMLHSIFDVFTPQKAYAQTPEGGTNTGIVTRCTCGDGYLTIMTDFSSNQGSGFYWWSSGYKPIVGDPRIAGPQLGFFTKNAGTCSIGVRPYCGDVTANVASPVWGEAPK